MKTTNIKNKHEFAVVETFNGEIYGTCSTEAKALSKIERLKKKYNEPSNYCGTTELINGGWFKVLKAGDVFTPINSNKAPRAI